MLSWQRTIYIASLAIVEATPAAMLITLAGGRVWLAFFGLVLAGAGLDWLAQRRLSAAAQRPAALGAGALLSLWLTKSVISGNYGPFGGWGEATGAFFGGTTDAFLAYMVLIGGLYVFWRGTQLAEHSSFTLGPFFGRSIVLLLVVFMIGSYLSLLDGDAVTRVTLQLLSFFGAGLLAIAFANIAEDEDKQLSRLDLRGLLTLGGTIMAVLVLGLLLTSVFGDQTAVALSTIWRILVLLAVLVMTPILLLITALVTWTLSLINLGDMSQFLAQQQDQNQQQQQQLEAMASQNGFPSWLLLPVQIFCAMLPIMVLVALYILMSRRRDKAPPGDEERQSLLSWGNIASDVRDLLGSLRRSGAADGLWAALERLQGGDPVTRVRRAYIRLLLAAEQREISRPAGQTPHEFAPRASAVLPASQSQVAAITRSYERARYHPASLSGEEAAAAERAWDEIDPGKGKAKS